MSETWAGGTRVFLANATGGYVEDVPRVARRVGGWAQALGVLRLGVVDAEECLLPPE